MLFGIPKSFALLSRRCLLIFGDPACQGHRRLCRGKTGNWVPIAIRWVTGAGFADNGPMIRWHTRQPRTPTTGERPARKDLALLQWLTLDQALNILQEITKLPTAAPDLIRFCEEGLCGAYIRLNPSNGKCDEAIESDAGEWTHEVFGAGYQHVANPEFLLSQRKSKVVTVRLTGTVRTEPKAASPEIEYIDWDTSIDPSDHPFLFKTSEIGHLATQINGAENIDPRERKSINQLIETLAVMAGLDLAHPAAAMVTIQEATALAGYKVLNKDTIIKYLKLAKGSRPLAPPSA